MSVNVQSKCWILALVIRDDGERLLLGDGMYDFKENQQHFAPNTFENDTVEVQGTDGVLLAGQVRRPAAQAFDGFVGDGSSSKAEVEAARRAFFMFFRKNHFYAVVYVFQDGTAIQRRRGFIVEAPEVEELWQIHPAYHVALNFEDVNYYDYNEDEDGNEIYSQAVSIPLATATKGGLIWDADGVVWDSLGATWEAGTGGSNVITVDSIDNVYPVITITGPAVNPSLENVTTGGLLTYTGTITNTQTLVIDMAEQTAKLNGTSVLQNLYGDWLSFAPGNNTIAFITQNLDAPNATAEWNEVVG